MTHAELYSVILYVDVQISYFRDSSLFYFPYSDTAIIACRGEMIIIAFSRAPRNAIDVVYSVGVRQGCYELGV